jgi:hypothetical protein
MTSKETNRFPQKSIRLFFICVSFFFFQSCGEKTKETSGIQPANISSNLRVSQQKMDELVSYVASSKHLKTLIDEASMLNQLHLDKKSKTNRVSENELKIRLSTCKTEEDYKKAISTIDSDPEVVLSSAKKMHDALIYKWLLSYASYGIFA